MTRLLHVTGRWLLCLALAAAGYHCGDDTDGGDLSLGGGPPFNSNPNDGNGNGPAAGPPGDPGSDATNGNNNASTAERFNPWTVVAHDPFSTFAADVDSASYDIFVKTMVEEQRLPAPETVRTEEFVNYFAYEYAQPVPSSPDPFAVDIDIGSVPVGTTRLMRVAVQGRDVLDDRAPAHLVFLVDVSGSMSDADKLPLAKVMLRQALEVLRPDDRVSIVTYSSRVNVALSPTAVEDRSVIEAAIDALKAGGSTAGADGLELAYAQVETASVAGGISHIIMCTDGDFNVGPYTTEEVVDIVEARRQQGVTFTALGFGLGNLNDDLMEAVSNAGNGIYRVIRGPKTASRYVAQRLLSDITPIASDVKLQVEFNPSFVFAYRQVGYENRQLADDDFRDDDVDAGEIGSGHQLTALYELVLVDDDVPAPAGAPPIKTGDPVEGERDVAADEVVVVKLRYKRPQAASDDPAIEMRVAHTLDDDLDTFDPETELAWALSVLAGRLSNNPFISVLQLTTGSSIAASFEARSDDHQQLADLYRLVHSP